MFTPHFSLNNLSNREGENGRVCEEERATGTEHVSTQDSLMLTEIRLQESDRDRDRGRQRENRERHRGDRE